MQRGVASNTNTSMRHPQQQHSTRHPDQPLEAIVVRVDVPSSSSLATHRRLERDANRKKETTQQPEPWNGRPAVDIPAYIQHPSYLVPPILPSLALPRGLDDTCLIFMLMTRVLLNNNEMNKSNKTCWNKNDVTEMNEPFADGGMVSACVVGVCWSRSIICGQDRPR